MKNKFVNLLILAIMIFSISSCVERHYYREHRVHRPVYYQRRHLPPPPGVQINIRG